MPCTRYFNICHAVHRKSSVDQFHKQSFPLRWGCSSRCHDDHHKHQPACGDAGSGNLSGRAADYQLQLWCGQTGTCQKGFFHAVLCMCCLYLYILGCNHALPTDICFYIYCKQRTGRVFFMGAAHLYGRHLFYWFSDKLPAEFHGSRSGKGKPATCLSP